MARVKIEVPDKAALGIYRMPVRITDINYGGHLGNDAALRIAHEVRMQWLAGYGYTELNAGGVGMIMADAAIVYKGEGFYGDVLEVHLFSGEVTRVGFELIFVVHALRNEVVHEVLLAKTGMVCFDYKARKTVAIPEVLLALIK